MRRAFDDDVEAWMSVAMILGWPEWQLEEGKTYSSSKNKLNSTSKEKNKGFSGSSNNPFAGGKKNKNPFAVSK